MKNKQSPLSALPLYDAVLREKSFQYTVLLRLWMVLISTEIVLLALREVLGLHNDVWDYAILGLDIIFIGLILYFAVKRKTMKLNTMVLLIVLFIFLTECLEIAARFWTYSAIHWTGDLFDFAGLCLITTPLLYFGMKDIRQRELTEQKLSYLAYYDILTGLPNRQLFQESLNVSIQQAKAAGRKLAVMFIDLDRFKNINDTFGHAFGDQLLIEASQRLKEGLWSGDRVSRQGGDEFTVLAEDMEQTQDAEKVAQKIIQLLRQSFSIDGHELRVGCSIGIAMYPQDGEDAITLMKNADTAMYRVKDRGKNGYQFYSAEMNDTVIQKLVMEEWLKNALDKEEFVLYFQPQVDITSRRMNGMEALIRWKHPHLGFISPGEFIPLAEETGLIISIGEWVLRTACLQNKAWQLAGFPPLKMAVNISPIQFHQANFVQVVLDALDESGLDPKYLELEITEGISMFQVEPVIEKLRILRELGVHISMDDFGTGYSSLTYLKRFPINKLKIAQQFVRDITIDPDDAAIVQAIMAMARSLKLNVIAEGVETEEQLSFLLDIQCKEIQGYIYSRPVPENEFLDLLKQNTA